MNRNLIALLMFSGSLVVTESGNGHENNCHTTFPAVPVRSVCKGKMISPAQTRNFHRSSQKLVCTSNSDHYIRRPQKYDFSRWSEYRSAGQAEKAWDLRRALPDLAWQGHIPYSVIETWSWEECALGTDSFRCGTEEVCEMVPKVYESCSNNVCTKITRSERECRDVAKTCYFDQVRYADWHCSDEIMQYTAKFHRPSANEWNAQSHEYAEFLPNKYDLLPGEIEDIQVFNTNSNLVTQLSPQTVVGNAWNKYEFGVTGDVGAACTYDTNYKINVVVHTVARDTTKSSPNAFDLPVDMEGNRLEPLEFDTRTVGEKSIQVKPSKLRLIDKSSAVVRATAEHSRRNFQRETVKAEEGLSGNPDSVTVSDSIRESQAAAAAGTSDNSFFKNQVLRVRIMKDRIGLDTEATQAGYTDDSTAIIPSLNVLSRDENIALSDVWEINLIEDVNLYALQKLNDGRKYVMYVSMYQKGVPFYRQSCRDNPKQSYCWWHRPLSFVTKPLHSVQRWLENFYFSEEIAIPFHTDYGYDERGWLQYLNEVVDFQFDSLFHRRAPSKPEANK